MAGDRSRKGGTEGYQKKKKKKDCQTSVPGEVIGDGQWQGGLSEK
jgi:hypothetical protein